MVKYLPFFFTENVAFARLFIKVIKLRAQFFACSIKKIHFDIAGEFRSQAFDYCTSIRIVIEHSVAQVQT